MRGHSEKLAFRRPRPANTLTLDFSLHHWDNIHCLLFKPLGDSVTSVQEERDTMHDWVLVLTAPTFPKPQHLLLNRLMWPSACTCLSTEGHVISG